MFFLSRIPYRCSFWWPIYWCLFTIALSTSVDACHDRVYSLGRMSSVEDQICIAYCGIYISRCASVHVVRRMCIYVCLCFANSGSRAMHRAADLLRCFSVPRKLSIILAATHKPGTIPCLHGLRVLSMFWVILGHTYVWPLMMFEEGRCCSISCFHLVTFLDNMLYPYVHEVGIQQVPCL